MSSVIKRSELLNLSRVEHREDALVKDQQKRANLVEDAMEIIYQLSNRSERESMLGLIQSIIADDYLVSELFSTVAYTQCDSRLRIEFVNQVLLDRSKATRESILGSSLYLDAKDYEGTELEQLYSMVMETRLVADALVRYRHNDLGFDGWFVIVVVPRDEGGIGVLSRFSERKEDVVGDSGLLDSSESPRFITLGSGK